MNENIDPKLKEALKSIYDDMSDEMKEKARQCKTMDELMELAGEEGIELPDEVVDSVAGGGIVGWFLGLWGGCNDHCRGVGC